MVRRTHSCQRCEAAIEPGDVYAAVDVLDADGRLRVLLCRSCGAELRAFVEGDGETGRERDDDSGSRRDDETGPERNDEKDTYAGE